MAVLLVIAGGLAPQVVQAAASGAATATGAPTAVAATSGSSQAESGGTRQPASSTTTGAASQQTAQTTAPNQPATPASTPAPAATLGVVSYVAVIDVDAANQDIPPGGTAIVTLTGSERPQAVRIPNNALRHVQCFSSGVILLPEGATFESAADFKAPERRKLAEQGYTILLNMGDQESDLRGGYAEKTFKLPNPVYFLP